MKRIETDECNSSWKWFGRANGQWLRCAVVAQPCAVHVLTGSSRCFFWPSPHPSPVLAGGSKTDLLLFFRWNYITVEFSNLHIHCRLLVPAVPEITTSRQVQLDYFCSGEPVPTSADWGIKSDLPSASSWRRSPTLLLIGRSCISVCPTQKPLPEFCTCRSGDKQKIILPSVGSCFCFFRSNDIIERPPLSFHRFILFIFKYVYHLAIFL